MRVLIDENMWPGLSELMSGHEASSVLQMGWIEVQNGELLDRARKQFDVLLTMDKGILHQHNHTGHGLIVIVVRLSDNRRELQIGAVPKILNAIKNAKPGDSLEI